MEPRSISCIKMQTNAFSLRFALHFVFVSSSIFRIRGKQKIHVSADLHSSFVVCLKLKLSTSFQKDISTGSRSCH